MKYESVHSCITFSANIRRAAMLITVLAAASCGDTPVETRSCKVDTDCKPDERCVEETCVKKSAEHSGERDAVFVEGEEADAMLEGDSREVSDLEADGNEIGGDPVLAADPPSLDFGAPRIGDAVQRELTIHNVGKGLLAIHSLTFEQGTSDEFQVEPAGDVDLKVAPGETVKVTVTYVPDNPGPDTGALLVGSNDPNFPVTRVPLSSSEEGESEFSLVSSPQESNQQVKDLDFGDVALGASSVKTVYVKNLGTGNAALTVSAVRVEGEGADSFTITPAVPPEVYLSPFDALCPSGVNDCLDGEQCNQGVCVGPLGEIRDVLRLDIEFKPATAGEYQAVLTIENDEDDGNLDGDEKNYQVTLQGKGEAPVLSVLPNPVDFGLVYVGESADKDVVMKNEGAGDIHVSSVTLEEGGQVFRIDTGGQTSWDLGPGQEAGFKVTYEPKNVSAGDTGKIVVRADDLDPVEVSLTGRSGDAPAIELSSKNVDFGEVQVGAKAEKSVTIRNKGGQDLEIAKLEFSNGVTPEFDFSPKSVSPISSGGEVTLKFTYSPVDEGTDTGGMIIECNDPDNERIGIVLTGTGVNPTLVVNPPGATFKDTFRGATSEPVEFQLSKTGSGSLEVSAIELNPGSDQVFDIDLSGIPGGLPKVLDQPGSKVIFNVTFTPSSEGDFTGAVRITTNDIDGNVNLVPLAGKGVGCPEGYWDANQDPSDGCEYGPCTPTGNEVCNGKDDDCDAKVDEGPISSLCTTPQNAAIVACEQGECRVTACITGYWDNNHVFSDGCEFGPCFVTPLACDGKDNDCNGLIDDAPADQLCQVPPNAQNVACVAAECSVTSCQAGYYDVDGSYANGCECSQDCWGGLDPNSHVTGITCQNGSTCVLLGCEGGYYDLDQQFGNGCECYQSGTEGGKSCPQAVRLPDVSDNNSPITVSSNIPWATKPDDSDWFAFKAVDTRGDDNVGRDRFKVQVKFTSNPGNQYRFNLYKKKGTVMNCDGMSTLCLNQTTGDTAEDHPGGGTNTEDQCNCIPYGQPLVAGRDHCDDDSAWYFLQVFRTGSVAMTCDPFVIEIRNGGGCP